MMTQKDFERIDFVKGLRLGATNLKKNIKDWNFDFDYKLTKKEAEVVKALIEVFEELDEVADVYDILETYERQMGED